MGGEVTPVPIQWTPQFERQEIWVMNTYYLLFKPQGPQVSPKYTFWSRLDECSKVVASSPAHATVRLFWADAVVSVEGPDLGRWMSHVGQKAPSEQTFAKFLYQNIEAAWRGEERTRTLKEAIADYDGKDPFWIQLPAGGGQPTPGIFVRKCRKEEGENWDDCNWQTWPLRPTLESMNLFLPNLCNKASCYVDSPPTPPEAIVGVLLEYSGVDLRFLARQPLGRRISGELPDPRGCVTILGGPKGMSERVIDSVREAFRTNGTRLLEVCLGPEEEMAHACVAFLRLQDDAGQYRASLTDLCRLGRSRYEQFVKAMDASMEAAAASWVPPLDVEIAGSNAGIKQSLLEVRRSRSKTRSPRG